jgi:hypothetical protein
MQRRPILRLVANSLRSDRDQARAETVQFGPLSMRWPHAYNKVRDDTPIVLAGPHGEQVTVSVYPAAAEVASHDEVAAEDARKLVEGSTRLVRSAAQGFGHAIVSAARAALPDGSVLVSAASESEQAKNSNYLLQFSVISRCGDMAYVTVEGKSMPASEEYEALLPFFRTVRWQHDAARTPVLNA